MSREGDDAFARLEARFVEISGLLERLRRYRALAGDESRLTRDAGKLSSEIRAALRVDDAARAAALEPRAAGLVAAAAERLDSVVASAGYRDLVGAIDAEDPERVAALAPVVFADVVAATPAERLFHPVLGARGSDVLEPEVGIGRIREIASEGFAPAPGPGVGADEHVRPIRFYDGPEGLDVAVMLAVEGTDVEAPCFRAGLGETLVYRARLRVPFRVALKRESPDEWLEARPGGYEAYRGRWERLLDESGFARFDV